MLVRVKKSWELPESQVTPEDHYFNRRQIMAGVGVAAMPGLAWASKYDDLAPSAFNTDEKLTSFEDITSYNNFYEFGTGKGDPAKYAHKLTTNPWSVKVEGHCDKPGTYDLDDVLKNQNIEECIYRLRCVEAWSMVIPWAGIALGDVLKQFEPTSKAKYVQFDTLVRASEMRGVRRGSLDFPYQEGLRMDEAMHPLATLAVGLYGKILPNQNGAPLRLVVPWKYGFKSIKSIVGIRFTDREPATSWNQQNPREYGFYSNVNPDVDHPRWSQKTERRIGDFFRRRTEMFNGYAEEVAPLYAGMNLDKNF
ncbi:MAG: protein-methionine-sulfoxide reductase catalytic subunit MsrP [Proteobacteria bacterium]|nr:protein-methionine-sulfoxide reductase catalytic subunit MsrP [Pseudomonadota bacterium]